MASTQPGQLLTYDFRSLNNTDSAAEEPKRSLKILQWNIERNYGTSTLCK